MERQSGNIRIWNKYWAFGGGQPTEDEMTYVFPNPYKDDEHMLLNFQFYMVETGQVSISIYNVNGQKVGTLLDEVVNEGITLNFLMTYQMLSVRDLVDTKNLDSGVYLFVMETEDKIKSKKFTIIK